MNLFRIFEQDKKLLIKAIAGIILLVTAFSFYFIQERLHRQDFSVSVIPENDASSVLNPENSAQNLTGTAMEAVNPRIIVDVAGAVANPSVLELPEGSRVFEAIEKAGGLTGEADTRVLNQAEILIDGQKLYIPTKQEIMELEAEGGGTAISSNSPYTSISGKSGLVNINTADSAALQQLSGIGPVTADKIINYRDKNGKFNSIEEIKNVSGIGEKTFEKFKDKITV